jgi:hypothetical protein
VYRPGVKGRLIFQVPLSFLVKGMAWVSHSVKSAVRWTELAEGASSQNSIGSKLVISSDFNSILPRLVSRDSVAPCPSIPLTAARADDSLNPAEQDEDDENEEQQSQSTARIILDVFILLLDFKTTPPTQCCRAL